MFTYRVFKRITLHYSNEANNCKSEYLSKNVDSEN